MVPAADEENVGGETRPSSQFKEGAPISLSKPVPTGLREIQEISLARYLRGIHAEEVETLGKLTDIDLRKRVAWFQIGLFLLANAFVAVLLVWMVDFDHDTIREAYAERAEAIAAQRDPAEVTIPEAIISSEVIMALIAGTVAEVGAAWLAITRYLFPRGK